jgi:hypothetical protein
MDGEALFWELADPLYEDPAVSRSTMMGFPCLRVDGKFFASLDHRNANLVIKLPSERVGELIDQGTGVAFAPAGKVFREWVAVPEPDAAGWASLLDEAKAFVAEADG